MRPKIRLAEESDAKAIQEIYAPIVANTATSFEIVPPPEDEIKQRITDISLKYPWLVCELEEEVRGYAYASGHRATRPAYQWSTDVSVYVHHSARRRGVGRALYTSLFAILVRQGYYNAFAGITLPNAGSVGLHESFGFQPIALYKNVGFKLGNWHDVGWWQLALQQPAPFPESPVNINDVKESTEFQTAIERGSAMLKV